MDCESDSFHRARRGVSGGNNSLDVRAQRFELRATTTQEIFQNSILVQKIAEVLLNSTYNAFVNCLSPMSTRCAEHLAYALQYL